METFVFSMGVISCLVSLVCGVSLTWVGVKYIISRDNLNIFQKGTYMVAYTYTSMIVGYLLTCTFPILITALIINDARLDFSFIKKIVNQEDNNTKPVEQNVSSTVPTDTVYSSVEQTDEQIEHSDSCDCQDDSCQCDKTICESNQCCRATFIAAEPSEINEVVTKSKSVLDVLKEEITQIHQSTEDDKLQTTN
jgi:hypothetical protein